MVILTQNNCTPHECLSKLGPIRVGLLCPLKDITENPGAGSCSILEGTCMEEE